ncbi:NAD-dependent epimerase/dehydratase family protein [Blastococcus sp. CT_GayMR16]|uniref:NAD-dependent epimerase/dehydratase family protein n=1 Tax=Blastococcus sp. CT_GayMR16 TaxID=2559607 RepID=UPI0010749916|nr:NAD-dependent epimerase/dehydratase family protein [Blastococcus sp. CT_GayMR16]TFV86997.1 NAD-dependent epimerase/dehydratase family protein [Blastococcus sp. CT_GayMR16]
MSGPVPVAVTGGAGFIGGHVTEALAAAGHRVLVVDNLSRGSAGNLDAVAGDVDLLQADVAGPELGPALGAAGIQVVCHLAAAIDVRASVADPVQDAQANVVGTVAVLQAACEAGARKVVFASSGGSIYGSATLPPVPESAVIAPESPYAASKAAAELWLQTFQRLHGLRWTALAMANVYGPRQDPAGEAGVISLFGARMLARLPTTIYGDGSQTRDFVYVKDVADAFVAACRLPVDGLRLNIGTGVETSVRQLHTELAELCGAPDESRLEPARPGELHRSALDASRARQLLDWEARTGLRTGLAETVEWLRTDLARAGRS